MSTHFDQIKSMLDRFAAVWKTNDGAAVADFFVEDGVLVNPLGERADGRAAVAAMYSNYFGGMLRGTSTTINVASVRDLDNSQAFADSEQIIYGPDGQVVLTLRLAALLRRDGDLWRFVDSRPYTLLTIPAENPEVNIETVRHIYAAFGRGDIPAILAKLADDVDWDYAYRTAPNPLPWLHPQRGREGVAAFFKSVQDNLEIHRFAVNALAEASRVIVALFDIDATIKRTGRRIVEQDEAHIWHFDDAGRVVRFRHCADTYQQAMTYQTQAAAAV